MTTVRNAMYFVSDLTNAILLLYAILSGVEHNLLVLIAVILTLSLKIGADIIR